MDILRVENYTRYVQKEKKLLSAAFRSALLMAAGFCLVVTLFIGKGFAQQAIGKGSPQAQSHSASLRGSGMNFTQNKGQIVDVKNQLRPDVLYKGECKGADVYLRKTGISYVQSNMDEVMHDVHEEIEELERSGGFGDQSEQERMRELLKMKTTKLHRVDVDFYGCNPNAQTQTAEEVEGYSNYYYPHCPQGITNVNSYNEVTVKNIYCNIDVKYYGGKEGGLKYDIVVNPGADPDLIKLKYSGFESIKMRGQNLLVETSVGTMEESIPRVYQLINGNVVNIKAKYVLGLNSREKHQELNEAFVSFSVDTYDPSYPLIIDPWAWATYYGGNNQEACTSLAVDANGNALITGYTSSANFPVGGSTVFQGSLTGGVGSSAQDAYVVKFSPAGARLWATFYGGNNYDYGYGITADPSGNVLITGLTNSANFPVGATAGNTVFQSTYGDIAGSSSYGDAFVVKFSPTGARLWATFYGGGASDSGADIVTESGGNIVITGTTASINFPLGATAGNSIFQNSSAGGTDAFVVKFNPTGLRIWATYYGGSGAENSLWPFYGIAVDLSNNIVIVGNTRSTDFPVGATAGNSVFQTAFGGATFANDGDAFVVKFAPNGIRLWATYYGGSGHDGGHDVAIDLSGNVVISGMTYSTNFPIGASAGNVVYQGSNGGSYDAFVIKFSPTGQRLWATYHGGNQMEVGYYCATDNNGNIYILGDFEDQGYGNFPMNTCALQPVYGGGIEDWFVTKFKPTGERICSTFIGGNVIEDDLDLGGGIATYQNYVYVAGGTGGGFPVTANAWQPTYGGGSAANGLGDAVVGKFCGNSCGATNSTTANFNTPAGICSNSVAQFTSSVTSTITCDTKSQLYKWYFPGASPATSTQQDPNNISYSAPGTFTVSLVVDGVCSRDSVSKVITVTNCSCNMTVVTSVTSNVTCNGSNNGSAQVTISNGAGGPYSYSWSNGVNSNTNSLTSQISGLTSGTYTVTVTEGLCKSVTSVTITQPLPLLAGLSAPQWSCPPNTASVTANAFNGTPSYTYTWSSSQTTQGATSLVPGNYTVTVRDQGGCTTSQTMRLSLPPAFTASVTTTSISCTASGEATLSVTGGVPSFSYSWSNGSTGNLVSIGNSTKITGLVAGAYTITVTDGIGCTSTRVANVTGTSPVSATFTYSSACIGSLVSFTNTGTPPGTGVTYNWIVSPITPANVSGTTTNFSYTFLTTGTYSVEHTVGSAGCTNKVINNITIINCTGPSVTATGSAVCPGSCATVTSSGSGGSGTYTYSWSNSATTQNISPCPATTTTYTVTIRDTGGSTSTSTAVVTINPAVTVTATATNIPCNGSANGSVSAAAAGGSPAFTYNWSTGATTSQISNLTSQIYTVTVTDNKGCTSVSTATVISPSALAGQFAKGTAACAGCGCKEWIMVNATGGTSPYSYTWPDGYVNRYKNHLCPGMYIINIRDKNGCNASVSLTAP
ncbi:MAG: SBBP repeat-containing protein [Bacteroidetes bacterium]|nr:SBBP repeat-containing protein [Bacteroidota bacterium]